MQTKKRTKRSRYRGTHTHGGGAKKRGRGSGHRGGVGNAGSGKRADHKKNLSITKSPRRKFGVDKRKGMRMIKRMDVVDLRRVITGMDTFVKKGLAKEIKGGFEIDFSGKKVLCTGELKEKLMIKAKLASKSTIDKVKKAGGSIELENKVVKTSEKKEEEQKE